MSCVGGDRGLSMSLISCGDEVAFVIAVVSHPLPACGLVAVPGPSPDNGTSILILRRHKVHGAFYSLKKT